MKIIMSLVFLFFSSTAYANEIVVLHEGDFNQKVSSKYKVSMVDVSKMKTAFDNINKQLPKNQEQATKIAGQLIKKHTSTIQRSFKGIAMLHLYDLKKLPAIVFDEGKYVYYGSNLGKAIKLWEAKK